MGKVKLTWQQKVSLLPKLTAVEKAVREEQKKTVRARAETLRDEEKASAKKHDKTGMLVKSIGIRMRVEGGKVYALIGPRSSRVVVTGVEQRRRGKVYIGFRKNGKRTAFTAGRHVKIGKAVDPAKYGRFVESGHARGRGHSAAKAYHWLGAVAARIGAKNAPMVDDLRRAILTAAKSGGTGSGGT